MQADSTTPGGYCALCRRFFCRRGARMGPYCSRDCCWESRRRPLAERFWEKVQKTEGCWLWTGSQNVSGHGTLPITLANGRRSCVIASRLSWELHHGPIPQGQVVRHQCDRPRCVNPDHLCLGTQADNNRDRWTRGTSPHDDRPQRGSRQKAATRFCAKCGREFRCSAARPDLCCSLACGNAYRVRPVEERFWEKVDKSGECWLWLASRNEHGYGQFGLKETGWRPIVAHRVAWMIHVGPIPEGLWVLHRCDNPSCVRPEHLFLGTQVENMRDCAEKGRTSRGSEKHRQNASRGERRWSAKLTEDDVRTIRQRHAAGEATIAELAEEYPVCSENIGAIISRKLWKHVP